jgi:hypothetical protein
MGNRADRERIPPYCSFTSVWPSKPGIGRYWKRQLSKARRRFARQLCRDGDDAYRHMGGLQSYETMVAYKTW